MADVENQQDSSFPAKRKSDLCCQEQDNVANKAQKLNPSSSSSADSESGVENLKTGAESSISLEKAAGFVSEKDENGVPDDHTAEEKQGDGVGYEDEEEEDSIEVEIDRKGKGISREDKGKGKLIEVDESDDSDDDDDDDDEDEYDESDLSDDPLAEVDLDNILPSRTRRRSIQPGVYISNDRSGNHEDDDDSSDDSDA
ncbi:hypothetical protein F2Q69_00059455 [Brassica cretica]|uniref:Histone chaperone domain-containing protein n=1 Tax=Brassica cretica TaxID=69181 RepID=A0A8S9RJH3_BRACR|nr:hypothetical protein F2Q69_00059455 [Brassica cretica]